MLTHVPFVDDVGAAEVDMSMVRFHGFMVIEMSKTPNNVPGRRPPLDVNTDQHAWLLAMQLWHYFEDGHRHVPAASALFPDFHSRVDLRGRWPGVDDIQNLCTSSRPWSLVSTSVVSFAA